MELKGDSRYIKLIKEMQYFLAKERHDTYFRTSMKVVNKD